MFGTELNPIVCDLSGFFLVRQYIFLIDYTPTNLIIREAMKNGSYNIFSEGYFKKCHYNLNANATYYNLYDTNLGV